MHYRLQLEEQSADIAEGNLEERPAASEERGRRMWPESHNIFTMLCSHAHCVVAIQGR